MQGFATKTRAVGPRIEPEFMRTRLRPWLLEALPDSKSLEINAVEFPTEAGRSAESSFVDVRYERHGQTVCESLVVRRQYHTGIFLESDLALPFWMMKALAVHSSIPVPDCIGIESDPAVLGTPFLVMRRCPGRIAPMTPNYNLSGWIVQLTPDARGLLWRNGIEMVARLRRLDWRNGFAFLKTAGQGEPGFEQYLTNLEVWFRWAIGERHFPVAEIALEHLFRHRPPTRRVNVLWGDATPHNILFDDDLTVGSVLDWEAATLGPAELDLAWWLFFNELLSDAIEVERLAGLPGRAETIAIYEQAAGQRVEDIEYYSLLAELRMTIVGIRASDRRAGGAGRTSVEDLSQSPACRMLARRLGLPVSEKGTAYRRACALLGNPHA